MELTFKEIEPGDMEEFCILMDELSERANSMEILKRQITKAKENPQMYLMGALYEGELVASLIGLLCEDFCGDCQPILFIENVVTLNKYRGKGIGRKMFEAIESWGKEHNCSYAVLVSGMNRTGAHAFYNNIGYSQAMGFKKYL